MQTVSILLKSLSLLGGFVLALLQAQGPKAVISQTPCLTFVQPHDNSFIALIMWKELRREALVIAGDAQ